MLARLLRRIRGPRDFDSEMTDIAKSAAKHARRDLQIELDFSPASVRLVEEKILSKVHEAHSRQKLSAEEIWTLSLRWGAYIGEVIKRREGGRWQRDSEKIGKGTLPLQLRPAFEVFPVAWVNKRIENGAEDDVAVKFRFALDRG
jgi:hypothetical protein